MRYLLRYTSPLIVFLAANFCQAATGDPVAIARKADSLSQAGDHYTASIYFRKAAFYSESATVKAQYLLRSANNLAQMERYGESLELLNSIGTTGFPDSVTFQVKYTTALHAYLNSEFSRSQSLLLQARYLLSDSNLIYQTYLLESLALNSLFKWEEARSVLLRLNNHVHKSGDSARSAVASEINRLYDTHCLPRIRSKQKALRMSTFLPGLGQAYSGYPGEGIFSFFSITVTGAAAIYGILNQYYFTSFILGNYIVGKFYQGGLARTEFLVDKKNHLLTNGFNSHLKSKLLAAFPATR